jgi:hypothetical protein
MKPRIAVAMCLALVSASHSLHAQQAPNTIAGIYVAEYSREVRAELYEFWVRFDTLRTWLYEADQERQDLYRPTNIATNLLASYLRDGKVNAGSAIDLTSYKAKWAPRLKEWVSAQQRSLRRMQSLVDKNELLAEFQKTLQDCQRSIEEWERKTDGASMHR